MTMGWYTVMEFTPSLVGCVIAAGNFSFGLIRNSGECVINLPTTGLVDAVVGIGNCSGQSGQSVDKFKKFGLTAVRGTAVEAPLIAQTVHYTGDGVFMVAGKTISRRSLFKPEYL